MAIVYDCRSLGEGGHVETSKPFDCLNYVLLIVKLNAYREDRKSRFVIAFFTLKTENKGSKLTN